MQIARYSREKPYYHANEEDLYDMYYTMNFANQTQVNVTAINCDEYISKYLPDLNSKQKESIMSEMYDKPEVYKCPDTDSISLTQSTNG